MSKWVQVDKSQVLDEALAGADIVEVDFEGKLLTSFDRLEFREITADLKCDDCLFFEKVED